jgi:hypothetical protein
MSKLRIWLLFILTFAAGVLAGTAGMRAYQRNNVRQFMHSDWERQHEVFLRRLSHELSLTTAQQTQVQTILRNTREQFAKLRQSNQPETRRILQENRQQIEKVLLPDQVTKYQQFMDRWSNTRTRRPGGDDRHDEHTPRHHRSTNAVERSRSGPPSPASAAPGQGAPSATH